jgi:hypothetical protein
MHPALWSVNTVSSQWKETLHREDRGAGVVYPRSEVIEEPDVTSSFLLAKLDYLEHYDRQSLVVKLGWR